MSSSLSLNPLCSAADAAVAATAAAATAAATDGDGALADGVAIWQARLDAIAED